MVELMVKHLAINPKKNSIRKNNRKISKEPYFLTDNLLNKKTKQKQTNYLEM